MKVKDPEDVEAGEVHDALPPMDFSQFILSFGTTALIDLGEVPHPDTGQVELNLASAQQTINMLIMLKSRTKGNLTHEEDQLLSKLVVDLQLKFVQAAAR